MNVGETVKFIGGLDALHLMGIKGEDADEIMACPCGVVVERCGLSIVQVDFGEADEWAIRERYLAVNTRPHLTLVV